MEIAVEIRVRGRVQGVGFRPTVWRHAQALGLDGEVLNDSQGVLVRAAGSRTAVDALLDALNHRSPPLARIDAVEVVPYAGTVPAGFHIAASAAGTMHTRVAPDAALCPSCAAEVLDPNARRYRYPFTNCTHCGPRMTIIRGAPYDRAATTMAPFAMCPDCTREYHDPADRRFHAEPIACPTCGPKARLVGFGGTAPPAGDPVAAAALRIAAGDIVALKGLGGYQLACDATLPETVRRLRQRKHRDTKPFALMAASVEVIRRYCTVTGAEREALCSPAEPIVLLPADGPSSLPPEIAPGRDTLGFMLPTTPLHLLLLQGLDRPLVMTSANRSDEPQVVDDSDALETLDGIADWVLLHDRAIASRVDDSVVRSMGGKVRTIRRARGYAPDPLPLPPGFETAPALLAMGGELKSTFCLVKDGQAILSQHQGDLEHAASFDAYRHSLRIYQDLFAHRPRAIAVDRHPDYLSSKLGRSRAAEEGLPLHEVQHHHAHAASCLAENGYPLSGPPVLAIVLDGLGFGADGGLWGGEFLLADYLGFERLAAFKPVAMPGATQAIREPWRNLVAHLLASGNRNRPEGDLARYLATKPCVTLERMIASAVNAPLASSCGRLFDAVAAALGISADRQSHEGEAAAALEALAGQARNDGLPYPFNMTRRDGELRLLDPAPLWSALLDDLAAGTGRAVIARRFHDGLAKAIADTAVALAVADRANRPRFTTVALSGGCFQNRLLFEAVEAHLEKRGFTVLSHAEMPANDGGLALGQAAIAAATIIDQTSHTDRKARSCASVSPAAS